MATIRGCEGGRTTLKADLHLHTREGDAFIAYGARELIDRAAQEGFDVLSITNHDTLTFDRELAGYARERGILLIPGVEATVEGKHVLLYNLDVPPHWIRSFADLRRYRQPDWLVVAPHPFYLGSICLGRRLRREIDLFDAVEFSHFYTRRIDFNRAAVRFARDAGRPLVGSSDAHLGRQFGTTYSLIEAQRTVGSVLAAIRAGHVRVVTRPLTVREWVAITTRLGLVALRESAGRALAGWFPARRVRSGSREKPIAGLEAYESAERAGCPPP
jgi:predicted metal-dependent phosphoesterase TrpH